MSAILAGHELVKIFSTKTVVDRVSIEIDRGETLAIVGPSGSGKSTLARMLVRLVDPTSGTIRFDGTDITRADAKALFLVRKRMQILFQDPGGALDPRMKVGAILKEPLEIHRLALGREDARTDALLEAVKLPASYADRHPHELSGGERQRVSLARALAVEPEVLVLDEPTSALDVLVSRQILSLLDALKKELGLTTLLITHDRRVVDRFASRSVAMENGQLV